MLALYLKKKESVKVGDHITIHNTDNRPIRIAIDAPKDVHILRSTAKYSEK